MRGAGATMPRTRLPSSSMPPCGVVSRRGTARVVLASLQHRGTASLSPRGLHFDLRPFIFLARFAEPVVNPSTSSRLQPAPALACPRCQGPVHVGSRHIAVAGTAVRVYCSEPCLRGITELDAPA